MKIDIGCYWSKDVIGGTDLCLGRKKVKCRNLQKMDCGRGIEGTETHYGCIWTKNGCIRIQDRKPKKCKAFN
jgi:hypothetical protein